MDALELLALQIAWGADEALQDAPLDRMAAVPRPCRGPSSDCVGRCRRRAFPLACHLPCPSEGWTAARARVLAAAATNTAALLEAVSRFEDCPLAATATSLVWEDGNPASGIMLVGKRRGRRRTGRGSPSRVPRALCWTRCSAP